MDEILDWLLDGKDFIIIRCKRYSRDELRIKFTELSAQNTRKDAPEITPRYKRTSCTCKTCRYYRKPWSAELDKEWCGCSLLPNEEVTSLLLVYATKADEAALGWVSSGMGIAWNNMLLTRNLTECAFYLA